MGYPDINIGCGHNSKFFSGNISNFEVNSDIRLPILKFRNFVQCSVTDMPFRDKAFSESLCSHVLEHLRLNDVSRAAGEIRRISRNYLIRFPNTWATNCYDHKLIWLRNRFWKFPFYLKIVLMLYWKSRIAIFKLSKTSTARLHLTKKPEVLIRSRNHFSSCLSRT